MHTLFSRKIEDKIKELVGQAAVLFKSGNKTTQVVQVRQHIPEKASICKLV